MPPGQRCCRFRGAHPRRCGADEKGMVHTHPVAGSSPQVRGRSMCSTTTRSRRGLIPAGAGQMARPPDASREGKAHPRRCGADLPLLHLTCEFPAHPRRCGADGGINDRTTGGRGLIPAGAGQIPNIPHAANRSGAHPRRCGADSPLSRVTASFVGSSPQVRGRFTAHRARSSHLWLIPAGAGQM